MKKDIMRPLFGALLLGLGLAGSFSVTASADQPESVVALKSGETVELANLFWVARCHSLLTGPIVAEALEAPPGLTVGVKQQDIVPHAASCAKPVSGGVLTVTAAQDLKTRGEGRLTIRVRYPTVDGERQHAFTYKAIVIPGK